MPAMSTLYPYLVMAKLGAFRYVELNDDFETAQISELDNKKRKNDKTDANESIIPKSRINPLKIMPLDL